MFFSLQVDRSNLKQAIADNLLDDLGLTTNGTPSGFLFSIFLILILSRADVENIYIILDIISKTSEAGEGYLENGRLTSTHRL